MLYEHVNSDGEVTQRVQPVEGSPNADQLALRVRDKSSGWRLAEAPADEEKPARRPRNTPPPANTPEGGALS